MKVYNSLNIDETIINQHDEKYLIEMLWNKEIS